MSNGPGSSEGFGEQLHWHYRNRSLSAVEKQWLHDAARTYMCATTATARADLNRWINSRMRTRAHAEQLCKRWGIEMPSREAIIALESEN